MANRFVPLATRFASNVIPEPMSGCHLWIGPVHGQGYGLIRVNGKTRRAHRVAWALANGPVPSDAMVLHGCDNTSCVNIAHLHLGDARDNQREAVARGVHGKSKRTHCHRGHAFTRENTLVRRRSDSGWVSRECRTCERMRKGHGEFNPKNGGVRCAA